MTVPRPSGILEKWAKTIFFAIELIRDIKRMIQGWPMWACGYFDDAADEKIGAPSMTGMGLPSRGGTHPATPLSIDEMPAKMRATQNAVINDVIRAAPEIAEILFQPLAAVPRLLRACLVGDRE